MIKRGIENIKKYGIRDTINKIIFKFFKPYLNFFYSKFNKIKPLNNYNKFKKIKIDANKYLFFSLSGIIKMLANFIMSRLITLIDIKYIYKHNK